MVDVYLYEGREVAADEPTTTKPPVVFTPRISLVDNKVSEPSQERIQSFFKRQKELAKELIPKPIVIPPIGIISSSMNGSFFALLQFHNLFIICS